MERAAEGSSNVDRGGSSVLAVLFVVLYAVILSLPLIIAGLTPPTEADPFLRQLGKSFALVAATILAMQAVLAGRLRTITRHYGLDMVLRFHKSMAVLAVVLLLAHPFLLAAGSGSWGLVTSLDMPWYIWLGRIALLLLLVQGVTSLFQRQLLDYQVWRVIHNQAPIILGLAFVHSWLVGSDFTASSMQLLWVLIFGSAVVVYALHKFIWPMARKRKPWTVKSVNQETHDVWTLELEPPEGVEPLKYAPGQFRFLTLYRGDGRYDGEEHHFTISSSPTTGPTHTSTIKNAGDFTATIGDTKPGDRAVIQGPYGHFSHVLDPPADRYLFIAGGIGITPLMSMLRYMRDTGSEARVVLLYGNTTEADIVFRGELDSMVDAQRPPLRVVHVLSEEDWEGETGQIDRGLIARHVSDELSDWSVYLCGPAEMMQALAPELVEMGVSEGNLHSERFWL